MIKILFVISVPIILTLSACNFFSDCKKIHFSNDDSSWLKCYNLQDTLIFKDSLSNSFDTLVITGKTRYFSDCNKFEKGSNQHEVAIIHGKLLNSNSDQESKIFDRFELFFDKELQQTKKESCNKQFLVFSLGTNRLNKIEDQDTNIYVPYYNKSLSGFIFLIGTSNVSQNEMASKKLNYFIWSKEHGLLSYQTSSGQTYELHEIY